MLKHLHVSGYRSIRELRADVGPITVVVGANGTGKTNVYRALRLLTFAAHGRLSEALAEEGGIPSVLWAGKRAKGAPQRCNIEVELDELSFQLSFGPPPPPQGAFLLDPDVKEETLWVIERRRRHVIAQRENATAFMRDAEGVRVSFPAALWGGESLLSQITEPHRFPLLSAIRSEFQRWRFYHHFRTDVEAPARRPQVGVRTPALAHDGRDLAAALTTISEIGDVRALHGAIERAFPGTTLHLVAENGRFAFQLHTPGVLRPLDALELSDGTLRYICLVAALLSPRPPPFLALNEPETSLHPELLQPLAELVVSASRRSQIFLTTHSELLADRLGAVGVERLQLVKSEGETEIAT